MPREGLDTQYTHHGPKGGWGLGGHMMHLLQGGLSVEKDREGCSVPLA